MNSPSKHHQFSPDVEELVAAERSVPALREPERSLLVQSILATSREPQKPGLAGRFRRHTVAWLMGVIASLGVGATAWATWLGPIWHTQAASTPALAPQVLSTQPKPSAARIVERTVSPVAPVPSADSRKLEADARTSNRKVSIAPQKAAPTDSEPPSMAKELELLQSARHAEASGAHSEALALLALHSQTYPNSLFAEERAALRIFAMAGQANRAQANLLAKQFARRYPKSVFVPKLQQLLAD